MKMSEILAQQVANCVWGLKVDGQTRDERFNTAKEARKRCREKYGIAPKARMMKKGSKGFMKKRSSKKKTPKSGDEPPEDLEPNHVAKVHIDGDIRIPKAIREQLPLEPGERWKFSIVSVSKAEFTVKAEKVEE